jgi:hypothetical protein
LGQRSPTTSTVQLRALTPVVDRARGENAAAFVSTDHAVVSTTKPICSPREGSVAGASDRPRRTAFLACLRAVRERPSSAPAASEPRGALDRGMRIVLRCDWRWLRCRPRHLGWRHADAHNDPISVALCGDPAGAGICSSPPSDLGHGLVPCHQLRIIPSRSRGDRGPNGRLGRLRYRTRSRLLLRVSKGEAVRVARSRLVFLSDVALPWLPSRAVAGAALRVSRGRRAAHDVRTAGRSTRTEV